MSKSLFFITIGPVKSSINNSRKMRDMYAGSFLLSYLINEVIKELKKMSNVEIIIPSAQSNIKDGINIPNKVIAKIEGLNAEQKNSFANDISSLIKEKFIAICNQVFDEVNVSINYLALNQLEQFIEIYWLFEEYNDKDDDIFVYEKAVEKMRSVKNLRNFNQINEEPGRKCSLYPDKNAIYYRKKTNGKIPDYMDNKEYTIDITNKQKCTYAFKAGEGLSAYAFVKRMLHTLKNKEELGYKLEISSVAYMLLKSRIDNLTGLTDESCEALMDLYNDNIPSTEDYSEEQINIAKSLYYINNNKKITPYYAIIKIDGDNMGNAFNNCTTYNEQQSLSERTSRFAFKAKKIATYNKGICIFAGGEDILMFLPIDTLFSTVNRLYKEYPEIIGEEFTFSAGIVIAHFMQPLKDVMVRVYEAEKKAKNNCITKNSFAIDVIKRSGEGISITNSFGNKCDNFNAIRDIVIKLCGDELSHSYLYNLISYLEKIIDCKKDNGKIKYDSEMIKALVIQANKIKEEKTRKEISDLVFELYQKFGDLKRFNDSIKIIDFLSKEGIYSDI